MTASSPVVIGQRGSRPPCTSLRWMGSLLPRHTSPFSIPECRLALGKRHFLLLRDSGLSRAFPFTGNPLLPRPRVLHPYPRCTPASGHQDVWLCLLCVPRIGQRRLLHTSFAMRHRRYLATSSTPSKRFFPLVAPTAMRYPLPREGAFFSCGVSPSKRLHHMAWHRSISALACAGTL